MNFNRSETEARIESVFRDYSEVAEAEAAVKPGPDAWSIKEIFGHLIDSAANNYQRFMRLQECERLDFPGYHYTWIELVPYNTMPYERIIALWKEFNLLLVHIIGNLEEESLGHVWAVDGDELSLEFLIDDYYRHLEEHLSQLEERLREVRG